MKKIIILVLGLLLSFNAFAITDEWQCVSLYTDTNRCSTFRWSVPGGWLVSDRTEIAIAITFYPDPNHSWQAKIYQADGVK